MIVFDFRFTRIPNSQISKENGTRFEHQFKLNLTFVYYSFFKDLTIQNGELLHNHKQLPIDLYRLLNSFFFLSSGIQVSVAVFIFFDIGNTTDAGTKRFID